MMPSMPKLFNGRSLMVAWRVLILLLLAALVQELATANRHLNSIQSDTPDLSGISQKLEEIHDMAEENLTRLTVTWEASRAK